MALHSNMPQYERWRYGQDGPGGGSVAYNVMATGALAPFSPLRARRDIMIPNVSALTRVPVAHVPQFQHMQAAAPAAAPSAPAPVEPAAAAPSEMGLGILLGADAAGRPVRHFDVPFEATTAQVSVPEATRSVEALKRVAQIMRDQNLFQLAPPLVSGPLTALARGEAVVLRWPNGVAIQAAI